MQRKRWATTGEAALVADTSLTTLQRWAKQGLIAEAWRRTPGGHLRWDLDKLQELLGITGEQAPQEVMRRNPATPRDAAAPVQPSIATAIVVSSNGVLAERRHDGRPLWGYPAGEIEPGESPEHAAIRETKEECGLDIVVSHIIAERQHPVTNRHMIYVAARPYQGTDVYVADTAELAQVRWLTLHEVDKLIPTTFRPVRAHLEDVLGQERRTA